MIISLKGPLDKGVGDHCGVFKGLPGSTEMTIAPLSARGPCDPVPLP